MIRTPLVLALVALLAGCGQKGALYLPERRAVPAPSASATPPSSATADPADPQHQAPR